MGLELRQSYTADALRRYGIEAPGGVEVRFWAAPDGTGHSLFLTPDAERCWCYPPTDDRNLCFFFSPSRLRLGVDRCRNKAELLSFHAATFHLPNERGRVRLFAALPSGEWCYLGRPVLGSGFGSNNSLNQFEIGLEEKLPEGLWLQFGGYRGWLVCTGRNQFVVQQASEVDDLLTNYWGFGSPHLEITRYANDALFAVTDAVGAAAVIYSNGSKELHTADVPKADDPFYEFVSSHGHPIEIPRSWVVPRRVAIDLIRRYFDTGTPAGLVEG